MLSPMAKPLEPGDSQKIQTSEILFEGALTPDQKNPSIISVNLLQVYKEVRLYLLPQTRHQTCDVSVEVTWNFLTGFPNMDLYVHTVQSGTYDISPRNGGAVINAIGAGNTLNVSISYVRINSPGKIYAYLVGFM